MTTAAAHIASFARGDAAIYSGPFVNARGRCTFLCADTDRPNAVVIRCEGGNIESVIVTTDTFRAAEVVA